jgi:ABC-2 type transport system permease protein
MSPRQLYIAYYTIVRREVVRFFRIWTQTFLPPIITTALYFLIFGTFIGSQIASVGGFSYMSFIVPGLVMMAVLNSAFQNIAFSFFQLKFMKTVEEILVSPMPSWLVVCGYVTGAVLRGLIIGALVFASAFFFEKIPVAHPVLAVLVVMLTAVLFALIGLVNAIYAKGFDSINIIPTFVLTPLTYLGGVFYSIQLLPPLWQTLSYVNPVLYMVNAFRYSILGVSDIAVGTAMSVLVGCCIVLFIWVVYLFKSGKGLRS